MRNTSQPLIDRLEYLCKLYYKIYALCFGTSAINYTIFQIGRFHAVAKCYTENCTRKVVPWAAQKLFDEYGVGLGYCLLQAPESMNAVINHLLENTNCSSKVKV